MRYEEIEQAVERFAREKNDLAGEHLDLDAYKIGFLSSMVASLHDKYPGAREYIRCVLDLD